MEKFVDLSTPPEERAAVEDEAKIRARNDARVQARVGLIELFRQIALALEPLEPEWDDDE